MKLRHTAALAFVSWYLFFATPAGTQDSAIPDTGIRGIAGCPISYGNPPDIDHTWPCGQVVDVKTGKDIEEVTCDGISQGFSMALPPGKYIVRLQAENETRTASVIVEEHKWTDISPWSKVCRPPSGPMP